MPVCDLECGAGMAREFIGPVRVVIVDDDNYYKKLVKLGSLIFVYILMGIVLGSTTLYILDFTIQYSNIIHVIFGTLLVSTLRYYRIVLQTRWGPGCGVVAF